MNRRMVLEGIGATLLLFPYYLPYVLSSDLALYHHGLPVSRLVGGLLVDMLCAVIVVVALLVAVERLSSPIRRVLNFLIAGLMVWRIVDLLITVLNSEQQRTWWVHTRKPILFAILIVGGLLAYFTKGAQPVALRVVRVLIAGFAFSALWIIPHLVHLAMVRRFDPNAASFPSPAIPPGSSHRRIVWMLFDELSYHQAFDHPDPDVKLPNLDRLRADSFSLSNLSPAGYYTERIVPSLFLGQPIDQIRSTIEGDLWFKDESQNRWHAFDPDTTLFGFAQRNGWTTGVDGWYNPYCHILATVLNACFWEPSDMPVLETEAFGAREENSVSSNAAVLSNILWAKLTNHPLPPLQAQLENAHIQEYRSVMQRTRALIQDGRVRFVFLHLPVPHPPGIYDRHRHILRPSGTYLDNLVLADDALGSLLSEIDSTSYASQTTVIVSSDHSWRIPTWRPDDAWTVEEERASGGRFDDRPVLLIHFPNQKSENDVGARLPELVQHDIIAGMLLGQINSPGDLAAFLAERSKR